MAASAWKKTRLLGQAVWLFRTPLHTARVDRLGRGQWGWKVGTNGGRGPVEYAQGRRHTLFNAQDLCERLIGVLDGTEGDGY